jgi:Uma2 family endonuclease
VGTRHALATAADLAALADGRAEVVGGEVVRKASPAFEHGDAQSAVCGLVKDPFQRGRGGPGGWWIASEVEVEFEAHEIYLPDVSGWRRDRVFERPKGRPVRIRPDWVCEVLSPTTAARDLGPKLRTYHRHGVPHYWLVDTEHETLGVYRRQAEGYLMVLSAGRGETVRAEPLEAIAIDVDMFFGH